MQEKTIKRHLQYADLLAKRRSLSPSATQPSQGTQGGRGVVVPGCPTSKKRINTMNQFLHHLAEDAMPALIEKLSEAKPE
jgi:hypothetical protein